VDKAVIGFFFRGYKVIVPTDCVSTHDQFGQESALFRFAEYMDASLTTADLMEFVPAE
jgi:nicotinamidase-related amidase